ncbi:MAG: hypothetical protein R3F43_01315 [bacterium]
MAVFWVRDGVGRLVESGADVGHLRGSPGPGHGRVRARRPGLKTPSRPSRYIGGRDHGPLDAGWGLDVLAVVVAAPG